MSSYPPAPHPPTQWQMGAPQRWKDFASQELTKHGVSLQGLANKESKNLYIERLYILKCAIGVLWAKCPSHAFMYLLWQVAAEAVGLTFRDLYVLHRQHFPCTIPIRIRPEGLVEETDFDKLVRYARLDRGGSPGQTPKVRRVGPQVVIVAPNQSNSCLPSQAPSGSPGSKWAGSCIPHEHNKTTCAYPKCGKTISVRNVHVHMRKCKFNPNFRPY